MSSSTATPYSPPLGTVYLPIWKRIWYFFTPFISILVFLVPATLLGRIIKDIHLPFSVIVLLNVIPLSFTILFLLGANNDAHRIMDSLKLRNFHYRDILLGFIVGVAIIVWGIILGSIAHKLGASLQTSDTTALINNSTGSIILVFLGACFINPIAEELWTRGTILTTYQKVFPPGKKRFNAFHYILPVTLSAGIFAFMHYQGFSTFTDFYVLFSTFSSGVIFAILAIVRKNIYASMCAHITNNLIISIFAQL